MTDLTKDLLDEVIQKQGFKANTYSPLALAYIGDGVYEMFIRTHVMAKGNMPVNKLHKASREFVKAEAQAAMYHLIEEQLTEEEKSIFKRGRNAKSISAPKNADIMDYRHATGLEALVGYLYLDGKTSRVKELIEMGIEAMIQK